MNSIKFENLDLMSLEPKKLSVITLLELVDHLINENFNLKNDLLTKERIFKTLEHRRDLNNRLFISENSEKLKDYYFSRSCENDILISLFKNDKNISIND